MKKIKIIFKINHIKEGKQTSRNIFKDAQKPNSAHKDKSKYTRKEKHKK